MKFKELKKQNKKAMAIASIWIETGMDGGWEIELKSIDTVENYLSKLKDLKECQDEIWIGILRSGEYLDYKTIIDRIEFEIVSQAEVDILNKYNAFSENNLILDY